MLALFVDAAMTGFTAVVFAVLAFARFGDAAISRWTGPVASNAGGKDVTGTLSTNVPENTPVSSWNIMFVAESDITNPTTTISYALISQDPEDVFTITTAGELTVAVNQEFDYEAHISHIVTVTASDGTTDTGSAIITIPIGDINDVVPAFPQSTYTVNILDGSQIGTSVITVTATDGDGSSPNNDIQSYSIVDTNDADLDFTIAADGAISVAKSLSATSYVLVILAKDGGSPILTGTTTVNVCVGCDNGKGVLCASLLLVLASTLLGLQQNARFV